VVLRPSKKSTTGDLVVGVAVTRRHDLTDTRWAVLTPLLSARSSSGSPPKWDKSQLIDGIRIGAPWRDNPAAHGHSQTVDGLFRRWQRNGTWDRILAVLQTAADAAGRIGCTMSGRLCGRHTQSVGPCACNMRISRPDDLQVTPYAGLEAMGGGRALGAND
jgi:transposase